MTKKNVELLVFSGAFDFTLKTREELFLSIEKLYEQVAKEQKEMQKGVMNLFNLDEREENILIESIPHQPVNFLKMLQREKELLGFYLSGHPLDSLEELVKQFSCVGLSEALALPHETIFGLIFIIEDITFKIATKSQRKFALLKISDGKEMVEMPLWPEQYEKYGALLKENERYLGLLQVEKTNEEEPAAQPEVKPETETKAAAKKTIVKKTSSAKKPVEKSADSKQEPNTTKIIKASKSKKKEEEPKKEEPGANFTEEDALDPSAPDAEGDTF